MIGFNYIQKVFFVKNDYSLFSTKSSCPIVGFYAVIWNVVYGNEYRNVTKSLVSSR